jgi:hypothetical protein
MLIQLIGPGLRGLGCPVIHLVRDAPAASLLDEDEQVREGVRTVLEEHLGVGDGPVLA